MKLKSTKGLLIAAGVLGSILAGATPALAQNHGGGGGHSGGGGGGGGGGHASAGAHFGGGGGGHFSGPAHGGGLGGHGYAPSRGGAAYGHSYAGHVGAYTGHGGYGGRVGYTGHPGGYGYSGRGYGYGHGYSTGAYWRGGYWRGGFWPRAYYGLGYSWFLPVLPLAYATYWWSGVPYYYANDVYYTYSPDYSGYVATDPPPVNETSDASSAPVESNPSGAGAQVYMYPKNGQSTEQQAQDRSECQQWATQQAGSVAQNTSDYNRAMVACVEGRGYSAR